MTLHVFNPEHDIALGNNLMRFTIPRAASQLRMGLGWIPALWAEEGDCILVDDVDFAKKASRRFGKFFKAEPRFVTENELANLPIMRAKPWGWDLALHTRLTQSGVSEDILPSLDKIASIRDLSSRKHTAVLLKTLRHGFEDLTCGESLMAYSEEEVKDILERWGECVIKAPWSCSGRGVRYVTAETLGDNVMGWLTNTIRQQGGVSVERKWRKVRDFGMEFVVRDGQVKFDALSMFSTDGTKYTGNLVVGEDYKHALLGCYGLGDEVFEHTKSCIQQEFTRILTEQGLMDGTIDRFGVDMMIAIRDKQFVLNPCVEVNLRNTMGHVAACLPPISSKILSMTVIPGVTPALRLKHPAGH